MVLTYKISNTIIYAQNQHKQVTNSYKAPSTL